MHGAQDPGDARGGRARVRSRQVYTMRRLLAVMILLLLLVLLVPRACQAFLGSEDTGPGVDQGRGTPEKAAPAGGAAGDTEGAAEKADAGDNSTGDKAAGITRDADDEEARKDTVSKEGADEADKDLGEILVENLSVVVTEPGGDETPGSADTSVDLTMLTPTDVGDQWQVDRLASINQQQAQASRREPPRREPSRRELSGQQPAEVRSAPAYRTGSSNTLTPVQNPAPRSRNVPPSNRAVATVASIPQPVLEPAPGPVPVRVSAPMARPAPVPVPPRPVVAAPIRRAPLPVVRGIPGRTAGASVAANVPRASAARFGRGVVGARINNAAAFPRAGAVRGAMRR